MRRLRQQKTERENYVRAVAELYPDWKNGILTQQEFVTIKAKLSEKIEKLDHAIQNLEDTAKQYESGVDQENAFLTNFRKYGTITELTRPMLMELVKEIRVYDKDRVEIELNFRDEFTHLIEYLEINRKSIESA